MRSAQVYNFLIEANILASIAIVLMIAVRKILRGKVGSRVLWFAWLLVAVRLLCPLALPNPAINEIRPALSYDQVIRPMAEQVRIRFRDTAMNIYYGSKEDSAAAKAAYSILRATYDGRLAKTLLWYYFGGVAGVLGFMVIQNIRFLKRLKRNRIEEISGELDEQYHALCIQCGVKPVPVWLTDPLPSACLTGLCKPFIALPLSTPPEDVMRVLHHEVSHVKGRDNLWGFARNLCCAVHWFNPLVWWAASMSRTDCELKCDDRVIHRMGQEDKLAYAKTLVQASTQKGKQDPTVLATCMSMTGRQMKQRVGLIVNGKKVLRWLTAVFASLASITLLFAFATAEYTPVYVPETPKTVEGFAPFTEIKNEEAAIAYTKAFMVHQLIAADTGTLDFKINREYDTWSVEAYTPDKMANKLTFDVYGMITLYSYGSDLDFGQMKPADSPITDSSPEGMRYLQLVKSFADDMLPGVGTAIDVIHIDSDVKNNGGRYLTISTGNGRTHKAHMFTLEIEPTERLLAFTPVADPYLAFNTTDDRAALSAYTEKDAEKSLRSLMTEVTGFTLKQVDAGDINVVFLPVNQVWVTRFTIASDQVKGELKSILKNEFGPRGSYTLERIFDAMGVNLGYTSLYAYQHRNDPVIGEERAKEIGLKAVADTLHIQGAKSNIVDHYAERAEYHVNFRTDEKHLGRVYVDTHTGEVKLIVDDTKEGEARYIIPAGQ